MSAIPARRRRRTITAAVTSVVAAIALPVGLYLSVDTLLNTTSGQNVGADGTIRIPSTPAALVVGVNNRNDVVMSAIFSLAPGGSGGTVISFPVGANAKKVRDAPIHRLADTYKTSGLDAYARDVEGTLNVSFSLVQQVSAGDLASMFTALGDRTVVLDRPVNDTDGAGEKITIISSGEQVLSPGQMAEALMAAPVGEPESKRLPILKAVWSAIAGQPAEEPTTVTTVAPSAGDAAGAVDVTTTVATETTSAPETTIAYGDTPVPADLVTFFSQMREGPISVWQLAAELITDPTRNPGALDLYALDGAEVIMVMASVIPSAVSVSTNNVTFLIDTPFGDTELLHEAVLRLAYLGANIILVREIDASPEARTKIFYSDELVRADVETYQSYLGPLEFAATDKQIEGINAQLVLGEDFRAFISNEGATMPTTTTSAPSTSVPG